MINATQEIFGSSETYFGGIIWMKQTLARLSLLVHIFIWKAFCISPSIYFFCSLFLWPFVLEQLCGCAYIMCNPAWQWEHERDGKKPFHLSINYCYTCPRLSSFYSLLYRGAFWHPAMLTPLKKLDEDADELLTLRAAGNKSNFDWKAKLWRKNPTKNNKVKTAQRRESKSGKKEKREWMNVWSKVIKDTDSCLLECWIYWMSTSAFLVF